MNFTCRNVLLLLFAPPIAKCLKFRGPAIWLATALHVIRDTSRCGLAPKTAT